MLTDNNTVIAQYNGIGFSFPFGMDDARRLLAESKVYKIEQHLGEPVRTTKYLTRKVQSYDPPQAAATEYRVFKPMLKIGPPIDAKKSRDASVASGHKRKRDTVESTVEDEPDVCVPLSSVCSCY